MTNGFRPRSVSTPWTGRDRTETDRTERDRTETDRTERDRTETDRAGPAKPGRTSQVAVVATATCCWDRGLD